MTLYLRLYWEFFKTGLFAIGGGMATLPFLKDIGGDHGLVYSQTEPDEHAGCVGIDAGSCRHQHGDLCRLYASSGVPGAIVGHASAR